jgi:hypothetical protein
MRLSILGIIDPSLPAACEMPDMRPDPPPAVPSQAIQLLLVSNAVNELVECKPELYTYATALVL